MWFGVLGLTAAACGGDDDKGTSGRSASYQDISASLAEPSGTVDADTAGDIGDEFEKVSGAAPAAGLRDDQVAQSNSFTQECDAGGSISASGSSTESSGRATYSYDNCCFTAGCCVDGDGSIYYSSTAGSSYSYCGSFDVDATCGGSTSSVSYSGCVGTDGEWVYRIEMGGETYAVSGTYSNGNGTLEITGDNGTFTCTYTNHSGSCTGSGGNFSFSS
jgi:hypothetical protein